MARDDLTVHERGVELATPRRLSRLERFRYKVLADKRVKELAGSPAVTVRRDESGLRYMEIITSNSYRDKEYEYVTTKALLEYVEKSWIADDVCHTDNVLLFWHDGDPIGEIVWTDMEEVFLIEVAKELPDQDVTVSYDPDSPYYMRSTSIKAVWDYIEQNPDGIQWGASHGFDVPAGGKKGRAYERIKKFETSVLPLSDAANPYTYAEVKKDG